MIRSRTIIAVPPGWTIKDQLENSCMTEKEFALRMGVSEGYISQLLEGEVCLMPEIANRLEEILGVPAHFWNNLEARYQERKIKAQEENSIEENKNTAGKIPYDEIVKLGWTG